MLFASYLSIQYKDKKTYDRIKARLIEVKPEGLLYVSNDYNEIVTIIYTDLIS